MNRAIKFRGKRLHDGKWVYGSPLIVDTEKRKVAMIVTLHEAYPDTLSKVTTSVGIETVGQFTGLTDKNGTEIYEGDIIHKVVEFDDEIVYSRIGVVCYEEGMYELQDKYGKHIYLGRVIQNDALTKLEVIGNIHDDKNLLEKGEQYGN